jgi:hypothetical protein
MKTEINDDNKDRFFCLYWGQEISFVTIDDADDMGPYLVNLIDWKVRHNDAYLNLKPLSSISDEDYRFIVQNDIMNPKSVDQEIDITNGSLGNIYLSNLTTTDYLRSKGYALPWMELSVEELIEAKWIKLIEL